MLFIKFSKIKLIIALISTSSLISLITFLDFFIYIFYIIALLCFWSPFSFSFSAMYLLFHGPSNNQMICFAIYAFSGSKIAAVTISQSEFCLKTWHILALAGNTSGYGRGLDTYLHCDISVDVFLNGSVLTAMPCITFNIQYFSNFFIHFQNQHNSGSGLSIISVITPSWLLSNLYDLNSVFFEVFGYFLCLHHGANHVQYLHVICHTTSRCGTISNCTTYRTNWYPEIRYQKQMRLL